MLGNGVMRTNLCVREPSLALRALVLSLLVAGNAIAQMERAAISNAL